MKVFSLVLLGACGLAGAAYPAHADDVSLEVRFGFRDGRPMPSPRGPVITTPRTPTPRFTGPTGPGGFAEPRFSPHAGHDDHATCEVVYIPAHEAPHHETVHVPAVYDDRVMPVFEMRSVPVKDWVTDPRTGRRHLIVVGMRRERVQVGERIEQVLVTPATTRVVTHYDHVPGRYVTICDGGHGAGHGFGHGGRHGAGHAGEVMTSAEYRLAMAHVGQAPRGRRHGGAARFAGERR